MKFAYRPSGVCSRSIYLDIEAGDELYWDIEDDKITNVSFTGGCNGNLKAISILVNGMTVSQIEEKLRGNLCGTRSTSCADQLAIAVREAFESKKA